MSTPSFPMTQPVGSPGGLKTRQEYDSAWNSLNDLNQRMYGGQQPSGRINSSSPYAAPRPGQGGIPSDAIFRTNSQQPAAPQTKQSGSMDFSAYAPGKAQPTQTPSLGTAYGQQNWYSPRPTSQSFGAPQGPTFSVQQHQQSPFGNYGNTPNARPESFTSQYFDYSGNPVSFEQQQAQRAAMVQQVRRAELPFVFGNALNQNMGPQTLDVPTLLGNANQMVDDGFYNPFLQRLQQDPMQQLGQYAPPSLYGNPTGAPSMQPFGNPPGPLSGGPRMPPTAPSMQADPYQQWLSTLPGYQPRDQWMARQAPGNNAPQPGLIDPRSTPPASPGGRYTPVAPREDSQTRDMRPQIDNADRFIRELTRTNPATWTETQWADYERAQRDTGLMDGGGYYRDQQGNVRYGGGYGPADRPADPTIGRDSRQDQYGTWGGSGGGSYSQPRPGQAQPIQPQSQGMPYGGKLIDIDKDGIDDRQQYGSPQEAMAARERGNARTAAARELGFRSTDQIDIASTLLNTGGARDRSRDFYGVQTLDSPLSYTQRADRLVERLGLLDNAGATITPAERAAAESLAAVLRSPANDESSRFYSQLPYAARVSGRAADLALFNSKLLRAEQALRSATEEGNRWRELSGYEKQWGGVPSTPPPAALNAAMDRDAQNAADIKLQREASARAEALYAKDREKRILELGGAYGPYGHLFSAEQLERQKIIDLHGKALHNTITPAEREWLQARARVPAPYNMGRGGGQMR